MADPKDIVILGASYGGLSTAHYLLRHVLPRLPGAHRVVLVSPAAAALCRPACPRAMLLADLAPPPGGGGNDALFADVEAQLRPYGADRVRVVRAEATALDPRARTVSLRSAGGADGADGADVDTETTLPFHALVIATGATAASPLLGLSGARDERYLRGCWRALRGALPAARSIVVVGGGPAGVEAAGELGAHLNGRAGVLGRLLGGPRPGPGPGGVRITLVTGGDRLLPALRRALGARAERLLAGVGVAVVKGARVRAVEPEGAGTAAPAPGLLTAGARVLLEDGRVLAADLCVPATGTVPNTGFLAGSAGPDAAPLRAADGRVRTNPATLRVDAAGPGARVYAVGDASDFARPAVHNVLAAVPVLCANLGRDLLLAAGRPEAEGAGDRLFREDRRETQLVPIGRTTGVGAAMGYQLPGFLIWLIKGRDYWLGTTGALWSGRHWAKES